MEGYCGDTIQFRRVSDRTEMDKVLSNRNKRHLQQVAMEGSLPSTVICEPLVRNYGVSQLAHKILSEEVTDELDQFPPVIRTWLQHLYVPTKKHAHPSPA